MTPPSGGGYNNLNKVHSEPKERREPVEITLNGQYLYFGDQMISFVSDDAAKQFLLMYVLEKEKQDGHRRSCDYEKNS